MENHQKYMDLAIDLAQKGRGQVNPNPLVGAVIVKNDVIIGSGYHEQYGGLHAERQALAACTQSVVGATLYVTLEPCCHYGKTPPCTEAIIENKISRVVIGSTDPNPQVSGRGIEILRQQGITVITGVRETACQEMNAVFFHYIKNRTPYVLMKYAMTLDGKIATRTGKSQWITGAEARAAVHQTRNEYTGIMVGVNTILQDDPLLTCRIEGGRNPSRIICDTHLRTPLTAQVVASARKIPTYLATCSRDQRKIKRFEIMGCKILEVSKAGDHLNLNELMRKLGAAGIDSILLEGGGTLNFSALKSDIVNKFQVYLAPKIFGGAAAKTPVEGLGVELPSEAFQFTDRKIKIFGEDICLEYVKR
ncbi:MAG: bifunctional diaminohydroxyphosphoribosylaminopyrimidine deaminase/5-amino-6-(5-phosphoribosylamino)uracil reductase RibD [Acetobacterium sp.]|nr:bifunctional diaminohydroxyphosphoribosylaminopyrimidine deaminase/5-amino-6-(5-phosphoribosylamino)uracil reductase RibD [Acetobacterium sp.]MDO9491570.1 bifunctional diaminohydroxyphosphoribosylaminopyrimidine deaminase/5-amino-6-(5-phosphoribosylamino)uracil reductase RibD [Acetobacterium sp.]PKM70969.1 MAG: riboflavin biosynthesis protein RibD [Firmicutes bacterium HGW-Firmicutes-17]